jgi:8-oxo-dGTP diphosphatase
MAPTLYNTVLSRNVRAARSRLGLSQADVVDRMRSLGFPAWHKPTLGNIERGGRRLLADEVAGLAFALETSISRLMTPLDEDKTVEFHENSEAISVESVQFSAAGRALAGAVRWNGNKPLISPAYLPDSVDELVRIGDELRQHHEVRKAAAQPAVVAAIVTSPRGVLVGRRRDGKPLWTFIAGEQEPGEQPEDTAIREVKEETGLRIQAGDVIGERVHPKTNRRMIYMAAAPTHGTDVFVNDEDELAEVRWAGLAEADELLPGLFGPVREHLVRELGEAGGS